MFLSLYIARYARKILLVELIQNGLMFVAIWENYQFYHSELSRSFKKIGEWGHSQKNMCTTKTKYWYVSETVQCAIITVPDREHNSAKSRKEKLTMLFMPYLKSICFVS